MRKEGKKVEAVLKAVYKPRSAREKSNLDRKKTLEISDALPMTERGEGDDEGKGKDKGKGKGKGK